MKKTSKKTPKGAPEWMVTYGDMISLLMCFFVLLFSMSSLEAEKMSAAIESLNESFGYTGDGKASNIDVVRERIKKLNRGRYRGDGKEKIEIRTPRVDQQQEGSDSPHGEEAMVQYVPRFQLGQDQGFLIQFKYGDDDLGVKSKFDLKKIGAGLLGSPKKIIIKGHTAAGEHGAYRQGIDLAYTRAVNVRDYLVSLGMPKNQFQILVVGEYEPFERDKLPSGVSPREAHSAVMIMISSSPVQ